MTGSFEKIDYRLRPAKHAERLMMVELCRRLRFSHIDEYQYIGMGSVSFVDHRVFHKGLGITHMVSFEATDDPIIQERFKQNIPLACIDMHFGYSTDVLPTLNYDRRSIVWLDYDDKLSASMVADISTLGARLRSGSAIFVTFACGMPSERLAATKELSRLKENFPLLIEEGAKIADFDGKKYADFGKRALFNSLERAMLHQDAANPEAERRTAAQVCYFKYRDGAIMCTIGWVIHSRAEEHMFDSSSLDVLNYYRSADLPFEIKVPKFTPFEISCLERLVPIADGVPNLPWLGESARQDFRNIYRFLPSFGAFEPV